LANFTRRRERRRGSLVGALPFSGREGVRFQDPAIIRNSSNSPSQRVQS